MEVDGSSSGDCVDSEVARVVEGTEDCSGQPMARLKRCSSAPMINTSCTWPPSRPPSAASNNSPVHSSSTASQQYSHSTCPSPTASPSATIMATLNTLQQATNSGGMLFPKIAHCESATLVNRAASPSLRSGSPLLDAISNSGSLSLAQMFSSGGRSRTFSTSSLGGAPLSPSLPPSPLVPRVNQIKQEEAMEGIVMREALQEKELTSKMAISQSWDDLSLDEVAMSPSSSGSGNPSCRPRCSSLHSPLHVFTPPSSTGNGGALSPSPSPKQCFSPSLTRSLRTPSSPSPTRVHRHRSQSPQLVLRPSSLAVKRKLDETCCGSGGDSPVEGVERAKRLLTLDQQKESDHLLMSVTTTD